MKMIVLLSNSFTRTDFLLTSLALTIVTATSCVSTSDVDSARYSEVVETQFIVNDEDLLKIKNSGVGEAPKLGRIIFIPEQHYTSASIERRRSIYNLAVANQAWLLVEGSPFVERKKRQNRQVIGIEDHDVFDLIGIAALTQTVENDFATFDRNELRWTIVTIYHFLAGSFPLSTPSEMSELKSVLENNSELIALINEVDRWKPRLTSSSELEISETLIQLADIHQTLFIRCLKQRCLSELMRLALSNTIRNIRLNSALKDFAKYIDDTHLVEANVVAPNKMSKFRAILNNWREARMTLNVITGIAESSRNGQDVYIVTGASHTLPIAFGLRDLLGLKGRKDIKIEIDTSLIEREIAESNDLGGFLKELLRRIRKDF